MQCRIAWLYAIAVILLTGMVSSAIAEETWISIDGTSGPKRPTAEVLSSNEEMTLIRFDIPGFWVEEVTEHGEIYHILRFPEYETTMDIGKAALPIISELIAIPANSKLRARIVASEETVLEGYHVYPFQTPLKRGEKRISFDIDRSFYSHSALYPKSIEIGKSGIWRDLHVTNIRVAPIRYKPARDELYVCTSITIEIEYYAENGTILEKQAIGSVKPHYDAMYRRNVLNYNELNASIRLAPLPGDYDLLIIIGNTSYADEVEPLVAWKEAKGIPTEVHCQSGSVEDIKTLIDFEYSSHLISYVLLVGDISQIPCFDGWQPAVNISDFYYTLIEGGDLEPEIAIGRFPARNEAEVEYMVQKTIAFEQGPSPPVPDWVDRALLVESKDPACEDIKQDIIDADHTNAPTYVTAFGETPGVTNQDIISHLNGTGVRVINYLGHGDETAWKDWNLVPEDFAVADVNSIDNGDRTPVVFAMACKTANLYNPLGCIAQDWVLQADKAVAYYGSSDLTNVTTTNGWDKNIFNQIYGDDSISIIGDAINSSIIFIMERFGNYGEDSARMFLLLGDPTLEVIYEVCDLRSPKLVSPEDGEIFPPMTQVTLDWNRVNEADYYCVQIAEDFRFSSVIHEALYLQSTEWTTPELEEGTYYWRAWAGDERGYGEITITSPCFKIQSVLDAPVLYSPADGAEFGPGIGILFRWYKLDGVDSYDLQIDDQPSFNNPYEEIVCSCTEGPLCSEAVDPLPSDTYYWRVKAENGTVWSDVWTFEVLEGARASNSMASHPNPFNPTTTITYSIAKASHVNLSIYNVKGQLVRTLVDEFKAADEYRVMWDGMDNSGIAAASGIYFYAIRANGFNSSKKLILLR